MSLLPYLATRDLQPELMDDPSLTPERHRDALDGLARINAVSRSAASIWSGLRKHVRAGAGPARVLDVACGGGDVAVALRRHAGRDGIPLVVHGCDISPTAIARARAHAARSGAKCDFFRQDVLRDGLPAGYDAIVCSLFLHHLETGEAVDLLRRMGAASGVVVIHDLSRGPLGYAVAVIGTRLLTRSAIVHVDGPRSVRGAFTPAEASGMAARAGLDGATVASVFPWRWRLDWARP